MDERLSVGREKQHICLLVPPHENYIPAPGTEFHRFSPLMCFTFIASILEERGYHVEILDSRIEDRTEDEIVNYIAEHFEICGVTTWLSSYSYLKRIISKIKAKKQTCLVVAGGPLFTSLPRLLFQGTPIDVGVIGEGEYSFLQIVENFCSDLHSYESIKGCVTRYSDQINPLPDSWGEVNLNEFPLPALHLWPSIKLKRTKTIYYETTRGCPFDCSFCSQGGHGVSQKSPSKFSKEVKYLKEEYQISHLYLIDSCFNLSGGRIGDICGILGDLGISWECMLRVNGIDQASLGLMKRSGCKRVWFGIESLNEKVLETANKRMEMGDIERTVEQAIDTGLNVTCWFILGLLGETESSLYKMVEFSNKYPIVPRPNYLIPLPNTPYWQMALEKLFSGDDLRLLEWLSVNGNGNVLLNFTEISDHKMHEVYKTLSQIMKQRGQTWK